MEGARGPRGGVGGGEELLEYFLCAATPTRKESSRQLSPGRFHRIINSTCGVLWEVSYERLWRFSLQLILVLKEVVVCLHLEKGRLEKGGG